MNNEAPIRTEEVQAAYSAPPPPSAGATPMMEQYIEIKGANADSLLFYRMGDFYELFFGDAEIASRALGITLTKRGKHLGEDIPMCGVPVHAADDYLQRLIALGHRVAVCEQTEDPAEAKKRGSKSVVRRDVIRLVTPGTLTEEKLLDPARSNYLAAVGRVKSSEDGLAIAWADISTGRFRVSSTSPDRLAADLMRIEPREIVVSDSVHTDEALRRAIAAPGAAIVPMPASHFDSATAESRIAGFYSVGTSQGFGNFSRAELSAISGVLAYLEKTQIGERPALSRPERGESASIMLIDPATRDNLELVRTTSGQRKGSLLNAIDRTVTGGGARLLAERLTSPLTDTEEISRRQDSVSCLLADGALQDDLRDLLKGMPDMPRALSRIALNRGGPRDLGALMAGLQTAGEIAARLSENPLPAELSSALSALKALPSAFGEKLAAALGEDLPLLKRDGGYVAGGWNDELDEMRALRDESRRVIARMQADLAEETGIRSLKIRHNNVLGYYIEVTANNQAAMTGTDEARARFIHRQTMANAMRFTTTELAELETKIANAAGRALEIELAVFDELAAEAVSHADLIRSGAEALAVIDVSAALAVLAQNQGYCRPKVEDSLAFDIVSGRHPVVEQALRAQAGEPFVANDCNLSPEENAEFGAIWLVTGPNMGGKSTFLRQNALIAILAQMGSFVPAGSARIGIVDRLFSRVGASDDLARGRSTFMVEMVETAAILNQASERSLVILDEIGRGTATYDGLSIAWASVEYLHAQNRCRALFATHFHEMTALSETLERLHNVTMKVREWQGDVVFLHEVGKGAADRSYGVHVARLAGLPDPVVERARDVLDRLEENEVSGKGARLADDLPLFTATVKREPVRQTADDKLAVALGAFNPDEMTPRDALEALYKLKEIALKD